MAFTLQLLRALVQEHPDRTERLPKYIAALEAAIEGNPGQCLDIVRTLFEIVHATVGPLLGVDMSDRPDFPEGNSRLIKAMDLSLPGHPDAKRIKEAVTKLLRSMNATASALAELSNIPNMRHGGSLDWPTLESHHAAMLGGLCDALASFLFEVAWRRQKPPQAKENGIYEDFTPFNDAFDDEHGLIDVVGAPYPPSKIIFHVDRMRYDLIREEWIAEVQDADSSDEAAA